MSDRPVPREHSDAYRRAIASPYWRALRKRIVASRKGYCDRCKLYQGKLELHHKTYDRLGAELDSDVEALCVSCHMLADRDRSVRAASRAEAKREQSRFYAWCDKVYGEDVEPPEAAWDRFCRWLRGKGETA